jgi:hypothetical protein
VVVAITFYRRNGRTSSPSAALRPAAAPSTETAATTLSGSDTSLSPSASMSLHPEREPIEVLDRIRRTIGEYNFAGQYQQSPDPLGGGLVKAEWFKRYRENELPERFDRIVQSWDTANKATELSDFPVCTTWGASGKRVFPSVCSVDGSNIRHSSVPCASSSACSMPTRC